MPAAGFTIIDTYRSLAKDFEQQQPCDMLGLDQEVPQSRHFSEDIDTKPVIKLEEVEQPYMYNFMLDSILNDSNNGSSDSSQRNSFMTSITSDNFNKFTASSTVSSSSQLSSLLSSESSPMMTSSALTSSSLSTYTIPEPSLTLSSNGGNFVTSKTSTYVTELAGSGCTVVSNTDFLSDSNSSSGTLPSQGTQEDSLEYIDLDKQPISLYDDLEPFNMKPAVLNEEANSVPLEEAVILMRDNIHNDCDSLNVPYDPLLWDHEHVSRWVSWVCQKNSVPDVSNQLFPLNGKSLCSIPYANFSSTYGNSGISIFNELELWKAANSCFPNQPYSAFINNNNNSSSSGFNSMQQPQHLHDSYMESPQTFNITSCVSPAPSTCSSSHDSSSSTISTHSDHSDDESVYGSRYSPKPTSKFGEGSRISGKMPTGRGHKQTIHLWQFLKELLVSQENHSDCIRWIDRKSGVFKIEDSKKVASLWGARKNRPAMNYDKLSRSVRQYYKKGIIKKTEQSKRLVYQFCAGYL